MDSGKNGSVEPSSPPPSQPPTGSPTSPGRRSRSRSIVVRPPATLPDPPSTRIPALMAVQMSLATLGLLTFSLQASTWYTATVGEETTHSFGLFESCVNASRCTTMGPSFSQSCGGGVSGADLQTRYWVVRVLILLRAALCFPQLYFALAMAQLPVPNAPPRRPVALLIVGVIGLLTCAAGVGVYGLSVKNFWFCGDTLCNAVADGAPCSEKFDIGFIIAAVSLAPTAGFILVSIRMIVIMSRSAADKKQESHEQRQNHGEMAVVAVDSGAGKPADADAIAGNEPFPANAQRVTAATHDATPRPKEGRVGGQHCGQQPQHSVSGAADVGRQSSQDEPKNDAEGNEGDAALAPEYPFVPPEGGDWVFLDESSMFWSEENQMFLDPQSGHFFAPRANMWWDPEQQQWYAAEAAS